MTYPVLSEPDDEYFFSDGDQQTTGNKQYTWDESAGDWVEAERPDGN